jgi:hypothetical protein
VAYLVPDPQLGPVDPAELRKQLATRLPDYMIPSVFVMMEALPLSPSGKVDHKQLPAPERDRFRGRGRLPETQTELVLAQICCDLLKVDEVSAEDSFFDLGGHSLLATQFAARAAEALHVTVPLRLLFEQPTIEALARHIDSMNADQPIPADTINQLMRLVEEADPDELEGLLEGTQED